MQLRPDTRLCVKRFMRTRTVAILPVTLAIAVSFWVGPLAPQPSEASPNDAAAHEVYAPSLTPAIYLVNFIILYMANPDLAAYMPAYKAPIPQPVVDCLEQNPMGCPWADYHQYFDERWSQQGMLLARVVSGECAMGASGTTQIQKAGRY